MKRRRPRRDGDRPDRDETVWRDRRARDGDGVGPARRRRMTAARFAVAAALAVAAPSCGGSAPTTAPSPRRAAPATQPPPAPPPSPAPSSCRRLVPFDISGTRSLPANRFVRNAADGAAVVAAAHDPDGYEEASRCFGIHASGGEARFRWPDYLHWCYGKDRFLVDIRVRLPERVVDCRPYLVRTGVISIR